MTKDIDIVDKPLLRFSAYYYGFEPTGDISIDLLLASVACAGKAFHDTAEWSDKSYKIDSYLEGETPVEWIQFAANKAAAKIQEQAAEIERLRNPWVAIGDIPDEWKDGRPVDLWIKKAGEYIRAENSYYRRDKSEWFYNHKFGGQIIAAMLPPKAPTHDT